MKVPCMRCQLTGCRSHYCDSCFPMERALGKQRSCLLPVHSSTSRAIPTKSSPSARGQGSSIAFIAISVTLFMGFHSPCAPIWQGCKRLNSKGFRQQMKTVPCLFNLKAFLGSVQHQIVAGFSGSFPLLACFPQLVQGTSPSALRQTTAG